MLTRARDVLPRAAALMLACYAATIPLGPLLIVFWMYFLLDHPIVAWFCLAAPFLGAGLVWGVAPRFDGGSRTVALAVGVACIAIPLLFGLSQALS